MGWVVLHVLRTLGEGVIIMTDMRSLATRWVVLGVMRIPVMSGALRASFPHSSQYTQNNQIIRKTCHIECYDCTLPQRWGRNKEGACLLPEGGEVGRGLIQSKEAPSGALCGWGLASEMVGFATYSDVRPHPHKVADERPPESRQDKFYMSAGHVLQ